MITVEWANPEQTIIYWNADGAFSATEYSDALRRSAGLAQSVVHPVGVIMDMRRAGGLPKNGLLLSRQVVQEKPDNMTITVLVSNSTFWEKIWAMMSRLHPASHINIQFSTSLDEAHEIIQSYLNLADSPPAQTTS